MHVVQILLPLVGPDGKAVPAQTVPAVAAELTERFGGVTMYRRAPAEGRWKKSRRSKPVKDEIVVVEVLCDRLVRAFWKRYRKGLENRFNQESILVRAHRCEVL